MENSVVQPQTVQVPNYSGVNIQIFNPSVVTPGANVTQSPGYVSVPSYPPNYYMQNLTPANVNATASATANVAGIGAASPIQPAQAVAATPTPAPEAKKTEKRQVVQLTDDYIKTLENYLNDPKDPKVRLMGAKEVIARLEEDPSRKDDLALNALINKMLQDPYQQVKFLAMAALNSRIATGDQLTVQILKEIQKQNTAYGEDSLMASDILLKMSGSTVEKEFEVKDKPKENKKKS